MESLLEEKEENPWVLATWRGEGGEFVFVTKLYVKLGNFYDSPLLVFQGKSFLKDKTKKLNY